MSVKFSLLFISYILVLLFHFLYAYWAIRKQKFSLAVGSVQQPWLILVLLLVLNGVSLSVFVFPNPIWIQANIVLHLILTVDEIFRTRRVPARFPFLLNHILFSGILISVLVLDFSN